MDYYFSKHPTSNHDEKEWSFILRNKKMKFKTDNGVFSKNTVDYGSRILINEINDNTLPKGPLLDMGCGYGPIGLSLAATTSRNITMVDINERAVDLAKINAKLNNLYNVNIFISDVYSNINCKFAAILMNPPIRAGKKIIYKMVIDSKNYLIFNGKLLIVIQKKQGEPSMYKLMKREFGNISILKRDKGYYVLESELVR